MNADPRRPEKVQRYTPKTNGNGEDLTPDYMNLMGQHTTTANAAEQPKAEPKPQEGGAVDDTPVTSNNSMPITTSATNVIPTSPQYGVAIIPTGTVTVPIDLPTDAVTQPTETVADVAAKPVDEGKELHSTPSRNDRFKVVKIASLEPFKRGRWKCMDYVDEAPPANAQNKVTTQSAGSSIVAGGMYLQTQSLPQQQIQQMLGFANGAQFFPNMQAQMLPPGQYFYPQIANMQGQGVGQVPSGMPAQFIGNQQFIPAGVVPNSAGFTVPQGYANVQYVPANLLNQGGAFVPTSQNVQVQNFQQSQTYSGQPSISQSNMVQQQQQPLVNGHAFPQGEQVSGSSLPTQTAKSVIMNSNPSQPVVSQTQINQQSLPNQVNMQGQTQQIPVVQGQQQFQQNQTFQQPIQNQPAQSLTQPQNMSQIVQPVHVVQVPQGHSQNIDQGLTGTVYTNPQFTMSVNSLLENDTSNDVNESSGTTETVSESTDDPAKTNPVVNAIDNKIEQAMDLVKSHLMYTVREEVEVLKEKIAELMEKIQQLETENNYLRSQLFKDPSLGSGGAPAPPGTNQAATTTQAASVNVVLPIGTNSQTNAVPSGQSAPIQTKDLNVQQ